MNYKQQWNGVAWGDDGGDDDVNCDDDDKENNTSPSAPYFPASEHNLANIIWMKGLDNAEQTRWALRRQPGMKGVGSSLFGA